VLNKLWGLIVFVALSGLIGCANVPPAPTLASPALPTKVMPVFKPILTATPHKYATLVPRSALEENQIEADDNFFFPAVLTVTVGSPVRWINVGDVAHNVEAIDYSWGTPFLSTGASFEHTFSTAGKYDYVCTFHAPGMRGTIVVIKK